MYTIEDFFFNSRVGGSRAPELLLTLISYSLYDRVERKKRWSQKSITQFAEIKNCENNSHGNLATENIKNVAILSIM
jgi:hypothetical protein